MLAEVFSSVLVPGGGGGQDGYALLLVPRRVQAAQALLAGLRAHVAAARADAASPASAGPSFSGRGGAPAKSSPAAVGDGASLEEFRSWATGFPGLLQALCALLDPLGDGRPVVRAPSLAHARDPADSLLDEFHAWLLAARLPLDCGLRWRMLYSSRTHGRAWPAFVAKVAERGPTVLVIRDTEGHVFGGYAPESWEKQANSFFGEEGYSSLVFRLWPALSLYKSTGRSSNFQYFGTGCTSGINPNGCGFGGKLNHFALFLDASFEQGHSFAGSTYDNPVLASGLRFQIDTVECWATSAAHFPEEGRGSVNLGVLDGEEFGVERALAGWAGLANGGNSEAYRKERRPV